MCTITAGDKEKKMNLKKTKQTKSYLSISAVQVVSPLESLHRRLTQLLLLQQQLQQHHQLLWRHLPRQGAPMRLILGVEPTSPTYWDPLLDVMKDKSYAKPDGGYKNHQAGRIMCILLSFFFYLQLIYWSLRALLRQFNLYHY